MIDKTNLELLKLENEIREVRKKSIYIVNSNNSNCNLNNYRRSIKMDIKQLKEKAYTNFKKTTDEAQAQFNAGILYACTMLQDKRKIDISKEIVYINTIMTETLSFVNYQKVVNGENLISISQHFYFSRDKILKLKEHYKVDKMEKTETHIYFVLSSKENNNLKYYITEDYRKEL